MLLITLKRVVLLGRGMFFDGSHSLRIHSLGLICESKTEIPLLIVGMILPPHAIVAIHPFYLS